MVRISYTPSWRQCAPRAHRRAERITELQQFSSPLDAVRASLDNEPPLVKCRTGPHLLRTGVTWTPVAIELAPRR